MKTDETGHAVRRLVGQQPLLRRQLVSADMVYPSDWKDKALRGRSKDILERPVVVYVRVKTPVVLNSQGNERNSPASREGSFVFRVFYDARISSPSMVVHPPRFLSSINLIKPRLTPARDNSERL